MTSNKYTASETGELEVATELFQRIRGETKARRRFEWLYRENPAGAARIWILRDPAGAEIGFTAGYPREVWVEGRVCRALNCGDFSVEVAHRTLGPAIVLRRPAKELVDSGEFEFLFAHPLPAMLPVHLRIGHRRLGSMDRWVLPLRVEELLRRKVGAPLASVMAGPGNAALRLHRFLRSLSGNGFEVHEVESFGEGYDRLDQRLGEHYTVIGRRTQAHLTWRFLRHPELGSLTILEARESASDLLGYLVLELGGELGARVQDLACVPGCGVEGALLLRGAKRAAEAGASRVSFMVQRGYPAASELRRAGFWERVEDQPTVCYGGRDFWGKVLVEQPENWYMTVGDRDV